jgi:hypothetical protein
MDKIINRLAILLLVLSAIMAGVASIDFYSGMSGAKDILLVAVLLALLAFLIQKPQSGRKGR